MSKHTPGPWQKIGSKVKSIGMNECLIAAVSVQDDEGQANANLIAAAPDLLASLEEIFEIGTVFLSAIEGNDHLTDFEAWADQARKAIAKARGES